MNGTFGPTYDEAVDGKRLAKQHERILTFMLGSGWKTLAEIEDALGYPQASISAQLRHLRKKQYGSFVVNKQRRAGRGTWEYWVDAAMPNPQLRLAV